MMKKSFYVTPKTEALVVRFEGMFLASGEPGAAGGNDNYGDYNNGDLD